MGRTTWRSRFPSRCASRIYRRCTRQCCCPGTCRSTRHSTSPSTLRAQPATNKPLVEKNSYLYSRNDRAMNVLYMRMRSRARDQSGLPYSPRVHDVRQSNNVRMHTGVARFTIISSTLRGHDVSRGSLERRVTSVRWWSAGFIEAARGVARGVADVVFASHCSASPNACRRNGVLETPSGPISIVDEKRFISI